MKIRGEEKSEQEGGESSSRGVENMKKLAHRFISFLQDSTTLSVVQRRR